MNRSAVVDWIKRTDLFWLELAVSLLFSKILYGWVAEISLYLDRQSPPILAAAASTIPYWAFCVYRGFYKRRDTPRKRLRVLALVACSIAIPFEILGSGVSIKIPSLSEYDSNESCFVEIGRGTFDGRAAVAYACEYVGFQDREESIKIFETESTQTGRGPHSPPIGTIDPEGIGEFEFKSKPVKVTFPGGRVVTTEFADGSVQVTHVKSRP